MRWFSPDGTVVRRVKVGRLGAAIEGSGIIPPAILNSQAGSQAAGAIANSVRILHAADISVGHDSQRGSPPCDFGLFFTPMPFACLRVLLLQARAGWLG